MFLMCNNMLADIRGPRIPSLALPRAQDFFCRSSPAEDRELAQRDFFLFFLGHISLRDERRCNENNIKYLPILQISRATFEACTYGTSITPSYGNPRTLPRTSIRYSGSWSIEAMVTRGLADLKFVNQKPCSCSHMSHSQ